MGRLCPVAKRVRLGGPRCGDPRVGPQHFIPAKSEYPMSGAPGFAKSPCRGAARRCAAACGLGAAPERRDHRALRSWRSCAPFTARAVSGGFLARVVDADVFTPAAEGVGGDGIAALPANVAATLGGVELGTQAIQIAEQ